MVSSVGGTNTGIGLFEKEDIILFPNPSTSLVQLLGLENQQVEFKVINTLGQVVFESQKTTDSSFQIAEKGLFVVEIKTSGRVLRRKLLIE